jgi:hypothetical protein
VFRPCTPGAFFTRLPPGCQWSDRCEVAPYERCARAPYDDSLDQILKIAFDGPLATPDAARD